MFLISNCSNTSVCRSKSMPANSKKIKPLMIKHARTKKANSLADRKQQDYFEKRRRGIIKLAITTCIAFEITFLPSVILWLVPREIFEPAPYHHKFCSTISWLNSAITPIIYFTINEQFRSEYIQLARSVFRIKWGSKD